MAAKITISPRNMAVVISFLVAICSHLITSPAMANEVDLEPAMWSGLGRKLLLLPSDTNVGLKYDDGSANCTPAYSPGCHSHIANDQSITP